MPVSTIERPVSALRQRMLEDMAMRGLRSDTQHEYIRFVRSFAAFLGRSPDKATAEDIRRFQIHQRETGVQPPTINCSVSALRFLFTITLDRPDLSRRLVLARYPRKLPAVLSVEEVGRLLEAAPGIKYKRKANGSVMLPHGWLFPGRSCTDPISTRQINRAIHEAAEAAGIRKRVSPHTLRHSFATHLLEQDVDIRVIQVLMGHSKLDTTALYARVATKTIRSVTGPLEHLALLMQGEEPSG